MLRCFFAIDQPCKLMSMPKISVLKITFDLIKLPVVVYIITYVFPHHTFNLNYKSSDQLEIGMVFNTKSCIQAVCELKSKRRLTLSLIHYMFIIKLANLKYAIISISVCDRIVTLECATSLRLLQPCLSSEACP